MIVIAGHFRLPPASLAKAREGMARVVQATRAEKGCIAYSYSEDVLEPGLIRVSEVWASREELAVHLQAPHMAVWKAEREHFGLTDRSITAYTVSGEEAL